jgi:hypothetical protein
MCLSACKEGTWPSGDTFPHILISTVVNFMIHHFAASEIPPDTHSIKGCMNETSTGLNALEEDKSFLYLILWIILTVFPHSETVYCKPFRSLRPVFDFSATSYFCEERKIQVQLVFESRLYK